MRHPLQQTYPQIKMLKQMRSVFKILIVALILKSASMRAQTITTSHITANGYDFTFLETGKGPMVLFLHGFPDNPYSFKSQMIELAKAGYHCVAPYKRGFTPGDTIVNPIQHSSLYTQDVLALIDAFKENQVILVGHDWGAGAAYGVSKFAPEKVKALITMAVPLSPAFFTSYTDNLKQMKRSWYLFYFQSPYAYAAFKKNDYAMIDTLWKDWCPNWENYSAEIESVKETYRKTGSVECAVDYYRQSFGNYTVTDPALKKIEAAFSDGKPFTIPTLYLHGQNDGCIGVENVEGMQYLFSNKFEKYIIPDAGHFIQMEKPEIVSKYMLTFIKSLK